MKKLFLIAALGAILLLASSPAVFAQTFFSTLQTTDPLAGPLYQRYFPGPGAGDNPAQPDINANCPAGCAGTARTCQIGIGPEGEDLCQINHNTTNNGYPGYLEQVANFGSTLGSCHYAVYDTEVNSGAATHQGYYAWVGREVEAGTTWDQWSEDCIGTRTGRTCLGAPSTDDWNGAVVDNTPQGTLNYVGGLTPVPVALPTDLGGDPGAVEANGDIQLSWNAASATASAGCAADATYELFAVTRTGTDCTAPTADEFVSIKQVSGTSTTVTTTELGTTGAADETVFFALRLRYPDSAGGTPVHGQYLSANSQCIGYAGFAVSVVGIQVQPVGRSGVQIDWRTELEQGTEGFFVTRALSADGPFERVSDLIPAKGEPWAYTYIDNIDPRTLGRPGQITGLWYGIEAVGGSDEPQFFGPVAAELPGAGTAPVRTRPRR